MPDSPAPEFFMADPVSFRLDGDIAAIARIHAEKTGVPLTSYVHELLRRALQENPGLRPVYVAPGETESAEALFKTDKAAPNTQRVWVFHDLTQPSRVWMILATLEDYCPLRVKLRPSGGLAFAVPRADLVAWSLKYASHHEYFTVMFEWLHAGASLHPGDTSGFKLQLQGRGA